MARNSSSRPVVSPIEAYRVSLLLEGLDGQDRAIELRCVPLGEDFRVRADAESLFDEAIDALSEDGIESDSEAEMV